MVSLPLVGLAAQKIFLPHFKLGAYLGAQLKKHIALKFKNQKLSATIQLKQGTQPKKR